MRACVIKRKFKCVNGTQRTVLCTQPTDDYCERDSDIRRCRLFSFNLDAFSVSFVLTFSDAPHAQWWMHIDSSTSHFPFYCVLGCVVCILFSPIFTILFDFWCRFDYCNTFKVAFIHLQTIWASSRNENRHRATVLREGHTVWLCVSQTVASSVVFLFL